MARVTSLGKPDLFITINNRQIGYGLQVLVNGRQVWQSLRPRRHMCAEHCSKGVIVAVLYTTPIALDMVCASDFKYCVYISCEDCRQITVVLMHWVNEWYITLL